MTQVRRRVATMPAATRERARQRRPHRMGTASGAAHGQSWPLPRGRTCGGHLSQADTPLRDFVCFSRGITGCGRLFVGSYRVATVRERSPHEKNQQFTGWLLKKGAFVKNRPLPKSFKHPRRQKLPRKISLTRQSGRSYTGLNESTTAGVSRTRPTLRALIVCIIQVPPITLE